MSLLNNNVQFITLDLVKSKFTNPDDQDDAPILSIVQSANLALPKRLPGVADDIANLAGTQFWSSIQSVGLTYAEAEIRRSINHLYTEAETIMKRFEDAVISLLGEMKSIAPVRTSRIIAKRDDDFENKFLTERSFV